MIMTGSKSTCTRGLFSDKRWEFWFHCEGLTFHSRFFMRMFFLVFRFEDEWIRWIPVDLKSLPPPPPPTKEEFIKRWRRRRRKVPVQITWTDRQNGRWRSDNQRSGSVDWRLVSSSRSQNMSCIKESTARRLFPGHPCRFRDLSRRDWSHFSRPGTTGPSQFVHRRLSASQGERE